MIINPTEMQNVSWVLCGQLSRDEPIRNIRIERRYTRVGRKSSCDLMIPSPSVSGIHAELTTAENQLFVRDLGSTNGTYVNGVRINDRSIVNHGDIVQFAQTVFRAGVEAHLTSPLTLKDDAADRALSLIQFDRLISDRAVAPHYQPIVAMVSKDVFGYELLGRSRLFGLGTPQAMFTAAAVLNMEAELSRLLRFEGVRLASRLPGTPLLFVNTHPAELVEPELLKISLRDLRHQMPESKLVLEIHEKAVTEIRVMRDLLAALKDLDIDLAYDDFGAGQTRLVELTEVPPKYLKFDICFIRDIHQASAERQKMLGTLVKMVSDLGITPLAEGIETDGEHLACRDLGFACGQGFYYGRPDTVRHWESQSPKPD